MFPWLDHLSKSNGFVAIGKVPNRIMFLLVNVLVTSCIDDSLIES